jgi:alpha-galactosidase
VGDRELFVQSVGIGFRWSGHGAAALRFLRHGWQSWSFTGSRELDPRGEPAFPSGAWLRGMHHAVGAVASDRAGWHESDGVTVVGAAPSGPACLVGVLERGRAFGVLYARPVRNAVEIEVELQLDALLAAGEERELERVVVALGTDAGRLLEAYAEAHGRLAGARTAQPFVSGWCSWYQFFHAVREDDVRRNLEALVEARARDGLRVEVFQIDDGYQRAVGDWLETRDAFPRGLGPLVREIRQAGFVPGLWTAPFCAVRESRLFDAHPEWLLRRGGEPFRGLLHPAWSRDASVYVLDAGRDDVVAHLEGTARELVDLGFRYLKLDFLYTQAMRADSAAPGLSRAGRLRRGLDALRAGAGDEVFLLGCGCPLGAAVGVFDGMRIGPDVAPSWLPRPSPPIPGLEATVPSTRSAVRSALARAWMHRRLWLNDPDCLLARSSDSELCAAERRSLAVAIAATGGMALFSDDVSRLSAGDRQLLAETLALAREVDGAGLPGGARAPDLLAREIPAELEVATPEGGILARLNAGDAPARLAADGASLAAPVRRVEPLLGSPPLGRELALDPHDSAVYRLSRAFHLAVFCDFDGTFSVQDVGATLAIRYAGDRRPAMWARYERGECTAWEYNLEILGGLPLPFADLEEFLRSVELDPGAAALVDWCRTRGVPFRVLSDGFDYNLNRLQQIHGVRFAYDANHLRYDGGVWRIRAGHPDEGCGCGTGTCKAGRIEAFRRRHPDATLVHVGNGRVSDLCGALAADLAFAKGSLADELTSRGVAFEPFETLRDVIPTLERRLAGGARRRRSA